MFKQKFINRLKQLKDEEVEMCLYLRSGLKAVVDKIIEVNEDSVEFTYYMTEEGITVKYIMVASIESIDQIIIKDKDNLQEYLKTLYEDQTKNVVNKN